MSKATRSIVTISLPPATAQAVKNEASAHGFASTSEFFRHIFREYRKMQLAHELETERAAFVQGKGKKLTSLKKLR